MSEIRVTRSRSGRVWVIRMILHPDHDIIHPKFIAKTMISACKEHGIKYVLSVSAYVTKDKEVHVRIIRAPESLPGKIHLSWLGLENFQIPKNLGASA